MRRAPLAALAGFPVVFPLLVLAASPGRLLPGLPRYRYEPLPGDAYGFYYCAREILASMRRDAVMVFLAVGIAGFAVLITRRLTRDPLARTLSGAWALGLVVAVIAAAVRFTGAAQMGWPLVWSVPLLPLRLVGAGGPRGGFAVGLALSLVFNGVTVVAANVIARRSGFGDTTALVGAGLVAFWPLVSLLTGPNAARNGAWQEWLGLSLYTEPLSTALVLVALAVLLDGRVECREAAIAGSLLGFGTFVRNSDVLILGIALAVFALNRRLQETAALAAGAAAWAPASILFWPKGYPSLKAPVFPAHPFEFAYARHAWSDSYLWHPSVLAVLVPFALVGLTCARREAALMLAGAVVVTALFYSFYVNTPMHPRFLYVVLPIVLVYWAAGADTVLARVVRRWASQSSRARAG